VHVVLDFGCILYSKNSTLSGAQNVCSAIGKQIKLFSLKSSKTGRGKKYNEFYNIKFQLNLSF
jgi:hypothetical protein